MELYYFQKENKSEVRTAFRDYRKVMYQAGTGSGKTVTAVDIIKDTVAKGNDAWFVAHRRELIEQAHDHLTWQGVNAGIVMAGYKVEQHLPVQVCSIGTLNERLIKNQKILFPRRPKLIIIDEAHRALAKTYRNLISMFPDAYVLGLSATPIRTDGRGLGHMFDYMVQAPPVEELIEGGYLVQPKYFAGATADLKGVPTQGYDYAAGELEVRMNRAQLRGDVVEQWMRHGEGRKSIVFASGVKHSIALAEDFVAAGIRAVHVDGRTVKSERSDIVRDFKNTDKYQVITNCAVFTEGFDVPEVGCVSLACPTKSIGKYLQMAGRCLRPHKESGKDDCIIIDHAGAVSRHGFIEDPVPWSLDTDGRMDDRMPEVREAIERQFECENCGCIFMGQIRCPECGTRLVVHGQHELINTVEELIEIKRGAVGAKAAKDQKVYTQAQKDNFLAQVTGYAQGQNPQKKEFKSGWVGHTYRAKFGQWPPKTDIEPQEPSTEVLAFIRAKNAAFQIRRKFREERA
jgi:superfamily II DNA or RNA helicase